MASTPRSPLLSVEVLWAGHPLASASARAPERLVLGQVSPLLADQPVGEVAFSVLEHDARVEVPRGRIGPFFSGMRLAPGSESSFDLGQVTLQVRVQHEEEPLPRSPPGVGARLLAWCAVIYAALAAALLLVALPAAPADPDEQLAQAHGYLVRSREHDDPDERPFVPLHRHGVVVQYIQPVVPPVRHIVEIVRPNGKPVAGCAVNIRLGWDTQRFVTNPQGRISLTFNGELKGDGYHLTLGCPYRASDEPLFGRVTPGIATYRIKA